MVRPGIERLIEEEAWTRLIRGSRYGLVCHAASVDSACRYAFDRLTADPRLRPQMLLVPEHGLFGEARYMEPVPDSVDPRLGLPVVSLYGSSADSLAPSPRVLDGLDAVVIDLQDVGSRYYTYLATMAMTMESAASAGVRVVIADRPNPIGGLAIEGNRVDPDLRSFVSWMSLPNRHGMTAGEVARWHAARLGLDVDLAVVPCEGLSRADLWPDTGLPFVPPSPNIPVWETALVYPGMCLLEGTNLSEGRGTTTPFFVFGAPFVRDPWALASALDRLALPGVAWRPSWFSPVLDKWAGLRCGGCQLIVRDQESFRPLLAGLAIISTALRLYPDDLAFREEAYEFVHDRLAIDLLLGDAGVRQALEVGVDPREIAAAMEQGALEFAAEREAFLLYGDGERAF